MPRDALPAGSSSPAQRAEAEGAEAARRTRVEAMGEALEAWLGSAYLFLQSLPALPALFEDPRQKPRVFRALKLALADATGSLHGVDILKVHCSDPHLIVQLKFCRQENCRKFLRSYGRGDLQESLQRHLRASLAVSGAALVQMELKAGAERLDAIIREEERCLDCIFQEKPNRLRDEEITELEESLQSLNCSPESSSGSRQPSCDSPLPSYSSLQIPQAVPPADTFLFQGQQFADRRITPDDHQKFAKLVSKKWKQVGRSLQSSCRALRDPAIDNLAIEYEREGLYEQAYQLLRRFMDSEGKRATLQRLVAALEENGLISLAEELVGFHQNENRL